LALESVRKEVESSRGPKTGRGYMVEGSRQEGGKGGEGEEKRNNKEGLVTFNLGQNLLKNRRWR